MNKRFFPVNMKRPAQLLALAGIFLTSACQTTDRLGESARKMESALEVLESPRTGPLQHRVVARAERQYRRALERALPELLDAPADAPLQLVEGKETGIYPVDAFSNLQPARTGGPFPVGLFREGVGLPVVGLVSGQSPPAPSGGYRLPVTLLVSSPTQSGSGRSHFRIYPADPRKLSEWRNDGREAPVAMDLNAPLENLQASGPGKLDGFLQAIQPKRLGDARLTFLEPFDPKKIPLVFIHGLFSSPRVWKPLVKILLADASIRNKYQFWFFYYPTGQPIPYSALQLREALDAAVKQFRPKPMILVGHSMGGILARTMVSQIEPELAERILPGVSKFPPDHLLRRALVFIPRSDVRRVVFISTPHRGSKVADARFSELGKRIFRLSGRLVQEVGNYIRDERGRLPTSIHGLSPESRFLMALGDRQTSVPAHSIIGQRRDGPVEQGTDGIVPFTSSHLPWVKSEVIVRSGHGAQSHPETMSELQRILSLH